MRGFFSRKGRLNYDNVAQKLGILNGSKSAERNEILLRASRKFLCRSGLAADMVAGHGRCLSGSCLDSLKKSSFQEITGGLRNCLSYKGLLFIRNQRSVRGQDLLHDMGLVIAAAVYDRAVG